MCDGAYMSPGNLIINDRNSSTPCLAMENSPSDGMNSLPSDTTSNLSSLPSSEITFPPVDEQRLLQDLDGSGKYTHTSLPSININHLSQVTNGSGRM